MAIKLQPTCTATCQFCKTKMEVETHLVEVAVRACRSAGWRVDEEQCICPSCRAIRKDAFLEAAEIAETMRKHGYANYLVMHVSDEIAKLLREKAEERNDG